VKGVTVIAHPLVQHNLRRLNEKGCLLPGLGDARDRLFGT
jgi:uracil phosphoribosyltransferase